MPGYTKRNAMTTFVKKNGSELPAGNYFIGDLGDFLRTDYQKIWAQTFGCTDGLYVSQDSGFLVHAAECGRGSYAGSNRHMYDGSTISIVHVGLTDPELYTGVGTYHKFTEPVRMTNTDGVIVIESGSWSLEIDTTISEDPDTDEGYDSCG